MKSFQRLPFALFCASQVSLPVSMRISFTNTVIRFRGRATFIGSMSFVLFANQMAHLSLQSTETKFLSNCKNRESANEKVDRLSEKLEKSFGKKAWKMGVSPSVRPSGFVRHGSGFAVVCYPFDPIAVGSSSGLIHLASDDMEFLAESTLNFFLCPERPGSS